MTELATKQQEERFHELIEPHRAAMHAHCYRMLGSVHDADDALQEAFVRAWRGLPRFEGRSAPRSWLYRIVTNACLDLLARRPRRVLPIDYGPPSDPTEAGRQLDGSTWIEPYPDAQHLEREGPRAPDARYEEREAIELSFVAALQYLPPKQRCALILRDVLGFSARESAAALDTTTASINSALQRARQTVEQRLPERSQQATVRLLGDSQVQEVVDRFVTAFEAGDVDTILGLLAEDATFDMPPYERWCSGREAIAKSWLMPGGPPPRLRYVKTSANAQPAVATYLIDAEERFYTPIALDVLTLGAHGISGVTAFRTPEIFRRFGLPDRLTLSDAPAKE